MKKNNMPLNLRERINSRISLLCSVIVLVLLVLVMHQMDYTLIRKPQKEAAEAAALKEQQDIIFITASCMNPAKMTPAYGIMTISTLMFWTRSRLQT